MPRFCVKNDPALALEIMKRASVMAHDKNREMPQCWDEEKITFEFLKETLDAHKQDLLVCYMDDLPLCSAVVQKGDRLKWANWPTDKEALYIYRYASNPQVPLKKSVFAFEALKQYAQSIDCPVIRVDVGDWEISKLRLYESLGFRAVGTSLDTDSPENYYLLEYDPNENNIDNPLKDVWKKALDVLKK